MRSEIASLKHCNIPLNVLWNCIIKKLPAQHRTWPHGTCHHNAASTEDLATHTRFKIYTHKHTHAQGYTTHVPPPIRKHKTGKKQWGTCRNYGHTWNRNDGQLSVTTPFPFFLRLGGHFWRWAVREHILRHAGQLDMSQ
jgi:hypothetical protein